VLRIHDQAGGVGAGVAGEAIETAINGINSHAEAWRGGESKEANIFSFRFSAVPRGNQLQYLPEQYGFQCCRLAQDSCQAYLTNGKKCETIRVVETTNQEECRWHLIQKG
jgi:hypothetical protein